MIAVGRRSGRRCRRHAIARGNSVLAPAAAEVDMFGGVAPPLPPPPLPPAAKAGEAKAKTETTAISADDFFIDASPYLANGRTPSERFGLPVSLSGEAITSSARRCERMSLLCGLQAHLISDARLPDPAQWDSGIAPTNDVPWSGNASSTQCASRDDWSCIPVRLNGSAWPSSSSCYQAFPSCRCRSRYP